MATPVIMPQIGQDIEEGKIVEWLKKENDPIEEGEILLIVESDKANFEVESPASGTLLKILYREEEEAKVLQPVAFIGEKDEKIAEKSAPAVGANTAEHSAVPEKESTNTPIDPERIVASPTARKKAKALRISLDEVKGSGPNGRIILKDIEAMASSEVGPSEKQTVLIQTEDQIIPFSRMRQRIAERLSMSKQTIPHFYLMIDADLTHTMRWRKEYNQRKETRVTLNDLIIRATALSLQEFKKLNAHVSADKVILKPNINLGVAVSVPDGLLVPVIPGAAQKSIEEISQIARKNADAAQRGVIDTSTIGTFTISNLGAIGVTRFVPIINPPECAILGLGALKKQVVPVNDGIAVRDILTMSLSADHRACDGVYGAEFLNRLKYHIENISDNEGAE